MKIADVEAVIESAKARGREPLTRYIGRRMSGAPDAQVDDAVDLAIEVIESIPVFLRLAHQHARDRNLAPLVDPLLQRAVIYFTRPVDLIPEMTQGLAGLLDDTYLVLRILENLEKGPTPFLEWDLRQPLHFLASLVGPEIRRQLDDLSVLAMQGVGQELGSLWSESSIQA